jgi:hypothetical protein
MDIILFDSKNKLSRAKLQNLAENWFGEMVKAVVDIEEGILAVGGEWHADAESLLISNGSKLENLWGFNLYPFENAENLIVFDSLINIRPRQNNRSMTILDENIKNSIKKIIDDLITQ